MFEGMGFKILKIFRQLTKYYLDNYRQCGPSSSASVDAAQQTGNGSEDSAQQTDNGCKAVGHSGDAQKKGKGKKNGKKLVGKMHKKKK